MIVGVLMGGAVPLRAAGDCSEARDEAAPEPRRARRLPALVAVFLLLPLLAVVPISFTPARFLTMPDGELSLIHYRELIDNPDWARSILLSLRIGVVSSVIATALALAFALGVWMFQPRFSALLVGFVLLPMIAPPIVSAMMLYFFLTSLSQISDSHRLRHLARRDARPCRDDRRLSRWC